MKLFLTILIILGLKANIMCQNYFVKRISDEIEIQENGRKISIDNNNDLYLLKIKVTEKNSLTNEIQKIDGRGNIKKKTIIKTARINSQNLIHDGDNIIQIGNNITNIDQDDSLIIRKYDRDLKLIDSAIYYEEIKDYYFIALHSAIEHNNKYLVAGEAIKKKPIDTVNHTSYIFAFNKDLSLDTIYELNTGHRSTNLFQLCKNKNGELSLFTVISNQKYKNSFCITTLDNSFNLIDSSCYPYELRGSQILSGVISEDGSYKTTINGDRDNNNVILGFDEQGIYLWKNSNGVGGSYVTLRKIIESDNSSVISVGNYEGRALPSLNTSVSQPYINKVDKNGKTLWQRIYTNKISDIFHYNEWFNDLIELPNKDIMLTGSNFEWYMVNGVDSIREHTLLSKVDPYGCLEEDRCSEVINVGMPLDSFYRYDQITTMGKEWYYTVTNKNGNKSTYKNEFFEDKRDYSLYNGQPENFNVIKIFRKLYFHEKDTSIVSDYLMNWDPRGKTTIKHKRNPLLTVGVPYLYDSTLYDFTLRIGDKFSLPSEYGTATVVIVDSIPLNDGYTRKRIILEHDNPVNREKYGPLVWIEGVGSPNGLIYFLDWRNNTTTSLNCYFDRDKKRYGQAPDCNDVYVGVQEESDPKKMITIHPNPVREDIVTIRLNNYMDGALLEVYDITGRLEIKSTISGNSMDISTNQFSKGIYIVKITTPIGESLPSKFIKQ